MRRKKLNRKASRKAFKKGSRVNRRNNIARIMRGGIRF